MQDLKTLKQIKTFIQHRINDCIENPISLEEALEIIKFSLENVIKYKGTQGKRSLINSQQLINLLHEVIKSSLISNNINRNLIRPLVGQSNGEMTLAGYLKFKKQDVCVIPNNLAPEKEKIDFFGLFNSGAYDLYGELFTEHILSINIRSQLSSLAANIDTMFERTYAEPLNLHRRVPKMVLGEVYLISVKELDKNEIDKKNVVYKPFTDSTAKHLEKYIKGFSALNLRRNQRDDDFKYERVALIIADFSQNPVKIYNSTLQLFEDNLLPENSTASIENLIFDNFIQNLLEIYERRFGKGIFS